MRNVLIYTDRLLPNSETFIVNQASHLKRHIPYYVGSRRIKGGLSLPDKRVYVANGYGNLSLVKQYAQLFLLDNNGTSRLAKELSHLNPKLIHAHYGPSGLNVLPLAQALNIPVIVTFHGIEVTMTDEFANSRFYSRRYWNRRDELKSGGDIFIAVSNFLV